MARPSRPSRPSRSARPVRSRKAPTAKKAAAKRSSGKAAKARKAAKPSSAKRAATAGKAKAKASRKATRSKVTATKRKAAGRHNPAKKAKPSKARVAARASRPSKKPATPKAPATVVSPSVPASLARAGAPASPPTRSLRIVLFGGSGMIGSRIRDEAIRRGHHVTVVERDPSKVRASHERLKTAPGNVADADTVARAVQGHDVAISAVSAPMADPHELIRLTRGLLAGAQKGGVDRLVAVGGAGGLDAGGVMLMDTPQFPKEWRPIAKAHVDAYELYRQSDDVDWTVVAPPAIIQPGVRKGTYKQGSNELLMGADGQSQISAEDYAVAVLDEVERGNARRQRITVAWP